MIRKDQLMNSQEGESEACGLGGQEDVKEWVEASAICQAALACSDCGLFRRRNSCDRCRLDSPVTGVLIMHGSIAHLSIASNTVST